MKITSKIQQVCSLIVCLLILSSLAIVKQGEWMGHELKHKTEAAKTCLNLFRQILWAVLMLCIWSGVWADWTDYEPFAAFIFQSASWVVIVLAAVFVLLSLIVTRPYCRFVCPMGSLFKM